MIGKVCFFEPKKKRFMQTESVLQTKNRSGPAKNRFSVAKISGITITISNTDSVLLIVIVIPDILAAT